MVSQFPLSPPSRPSLSSLAPSATPNPPFGPQGIDFRSGSYSRYVRFGKRTVKDGEAVALWNMRGVHRQIVVRPSPST